MGRGQNPLGGLSPNFFGRRHPRHNHVFQIWWRSVKGLASAEGQILPFPIDFGGRPYNTLTPPCERVMGNGKIWPSADAKPLNRSSPNLKHVTDYVRDIFFQKIWLNPPRGFCPPPPYTWNIHPKPSNVYFTLLHFSSVLLSPYTDFHFDWPTAKTPSLMQNSGTYLKCDLSYCDFCVEISTFLLPFQRGLVWHKFYSES